MAEAKEMTWRPGDPASHFNGGTKVDEIVCDVIYRHTRLPVYRYNKTSKIKTSKNYMQPYEGLVLTYGSCHSDRKRTVLSTPLHGIW